MGHSQAAKAASRERILDAAANQISEQGMGSVAVAELMRNAGLTKGAFYGHFESRDAMIAEAARRAMQKGQSKIDAIFLPGKKPRLEDLVDVWLHPGHALASAGGCGICALAGEARYAGPQVQRVVAEQFDRNVEQIAQTIGTGKQAKAHATAILTALIGAVSMSRAVGDVDLAQDILAKTRALILLFRDDAV